MVGAFTPQRNNTYYKLGFFLTPPESQFTGMLLLRSKILLYNSAMKPKDTPIAGGLMELWESDWDEELGGYTAKFSALQVPLPFCSGLSPQVENYITTFILPTRGWQGSSFRLAVSLLTFIFCSHGACQFPCPQAGM